MPKRPRADKERALMAENARLRLQLEQAQQAARPFPYPPAIEAHRADYEQIARAFNLLVEMDDRTGGSRLHIDLPYGADVASRADLVGTIQDHLYRAYLDINWLDPDTMMFLYVEMRMQNELWRFQQQQDRPDESPQNPARPRHIVALYARLGELMHEVMENEECAQDVTDALRQAWLQLRDKYDDIPTNIKEEFARLARRAA